MRRLLFPRGRSASTVAAVGCPRMRLEERSVHGRGRGEVWILRSDWVIAKQCCSVEDKPEGWGEEMARGEEIWPCNLEWVRVEEELLHNTGETDFPRKKCKRETTKFFACVSKLWVSLGLFFSPQVFYQQFRYWVYFFFFCSLWDTVLVTLFFFCFLEGIFALEYHLCICQISTCRTTISCVDEVLESLRKLCLLCLPRELGMWKFKL